ncbi:hypothetical protein [Streptomyces sp. 7N604]|uniref:hypothetical protein n=1 Tax=Streptomyces sp. 7N604 TaxID=3457415 RepID=UPI003FD0B8EE
MSLPEPDNWLVLDLNSEAPQEWAQDTARRHLGEDAERRFHYAFAQDLMRLAEVARARRALSAGVLAPARGPSIALLHVRELRIPIESCRLEVLRAEAEQIEGPFFLLPRLTEVALPLGPALRVHRMEPTDPESDSTKVLEGVAHYVLPSQFPGTALELVMTWDTPELGEALTAMADEIAASARLA